MTDEHNEPNAPATNEPTAKNTVNDPVTQTSPAPVTSAAPVVTPLDSGDSPDPAAPAPAPSSENADSDNGGGLELLDALRQVIDPELMINIVDLGLVYDVEREGNVVTVDMTLTSPACPAGPQIMQQSKMALERIDGVDEAKIKLVMSPPWSPDRMTDDARDQLGIF